VSEPKLCPGGGAITETKETKEYGNVRLREVLPFDQVEEIYTHLRTSIEDGTLCIEVVYRLIRLRLGVNRPPMLLLIRGTEFDPRRRGYVVRPLGKEAYEYLDLDENVPSLRVKSALIGVLEENGAAEFAGSKFSGLDIAPLWRLMLKWNRSLAEAPDARLPILLEETPTVSDAELEKILAWDWPGYVRDLLYMGAEKDERIALVGKSHMIPQFPEMRMKNSLSLAITNPGTGKSFLLSRIGDVISRTTAKSITGGARVDGSVVPSFLMGRRRPVIVEHLEAKPEEGLLTYLLTTISGIPSHIVVWQTEQEFSPYCAAVVTGNPNKERGQPNFQAFFTYLQGVTDNYLALGRRVGMILFGMDYTVVKSETDLELLPWVEPAWRIWWEIADRIDPLILSVYKHPKIQAWLSEKDEEYSAAVGKVYGSQEPSVVRDFWLKHGRNAPPVIKWRALCCALVDHGQELLRRALHGLGVDLDLEEAILGRAREAYKEIKVVNLQSLQEIQETAELEQEILRMVFEGLPRYLRELLVTVAHYATTEGAKLASPVEALTETFDDIKGPLGFYPGFSIIEQHLSRHSPDMKYGAKLSLFGVSLEETQGIWLIRLTDLQRLGKFLSLLSLGCRPVPSGSLTSEWETEKFKREVGREVVRGRLQEAINRGAKWIADARNRDAEGLYDLGKLIEVVGDRRIVMILEKDGLIRVHPTRRGKVIGA
jgi:hypothetical protein